jgi:hypothetical protein
LALFAVERGSDREEASADARVPWKGVWITESDEDRERRELLDLVYRLGGHATPRDLREHSRRFPTSDSADAALQKLVNEARGAWETVRPPGGGWPSTRFVLADSPDRPMRTVPITAT